MNQAKSLITFRQSKLQILFEKNLLSPPEELNGETARWGIIQ